MSSSRYLRALGVFAFLGAVVFTLLVSFGSRSAKARDKDGWKDQDSRGDQNDRDDREFESREIKHVFVIAMENHNWTQPTTVAGKVQPIFQNTNAPFINSLVNGTAIAYVNGQLVDISQQTSYASAYHNVLATAGGNNPHIHP